jgi:hypothetical protein
MTRREYIEAVRASPLNEEGLAEMRKIVASCTAAKVNECFIDTWSASAVVTVYDAVNEKNRARLLALPVARVCQIAMQVLSNRRG